MDAADPDDDDDADIHAHRQDGRHARHDLHHPYRALGEGFACRFEALAFEVGPHKGLDQSRPGNVLLQDGVEPVELLLHGPKERLHPDDEKDDDRQSDDQQGQHGQSKGAVGTDHQDQAPDHEKRGARADPQRDQHDALDGVHIAGQAHHQLAGFLLIEIGERKGLDPGEERFAQIAGHAFPDLYGQDVVADGKKRADKRNTEHQKGCPYDDALVMLPDPLIDDPLDQPGDGKIHEDQRGQQGQGQGGALPIRLHKSGKFEYLVHLQNFRKSFHLGGPVIRDFSSHLSEFRWVPKFFFFIDPDQ